MKKIITVTCAAILSAAMLAGCAGSSSSQAQPETSDASGVKKIESLKIAFSPYADSDAITSSTEPLEALLQEKLLEAGYEVGEVYMTVGTSYTAVGEALSAGSADIGFISGGNYVLFSDDCEVLVTALRNAINKDSENPADWNDGSPEEYTNDFQTYYRCIILAGPSAKGRELADKVNSGQELTWEDLNSASWGVLDPSSSSGYIYPALWLKENYGKGISDLANVRQLESHTSAIAALAAEQVDVMVSYAHIRIKNAEPWTSEYGRPDSIWNETDIIGVTQGIYNDLIAYSENSPLMQDEGFRQALGQAFIDIGSTDQGKEIISVFSQIGYTWGEDSNYDGAREAEELLKSME